MSITDELRTSGVHMPFSDTRVFLNEELTAIANRIDEAVYGMVELPKDADGVPIRFGDVLDQFGTPMTVFAMSDPDPSQGDCMLELITDGVSDGMWVRARKMRHYHATAVENVLREFAQECLTYATNVDDHEVVDAIEKYAKRLTLAGDAE